MAKFLDFEQCLVREENRKDFVSIIQSIGGKSLNDVVVRAMEQIVKDCVAKDINWEGELRKGVQKHSFRKSKIKTVLFGKHRKTLSLTHRKTVAMRNVLIYFTRYAEARIRR